MNIARERRGSRWWLWWPLLGLAAWLAFAWETPVPPDALSLPTSVLPGSREPIGRRDMPPKRPASDEELLALVPRIRLVGPAPSSAEGPSRPLFTSRAWNPPPVAATPPAAPSAPAMPYTFLGKKHESGAWEIYLGRGEQSFIAREGQVLEGAWRVDAIAPPSMTLTYLPLNQAQTLAVGDSR